MIWLIHGPRRLTVGALFVRRGVVAILRMTIEAGVRCSIKAAVDPNLTAPVLQTGRWKLGKPPSRLRQRCAVRRLRAAPCMLGLSQFAF
jgi:hypothetical protein